MHHHIPYAEWDGNFPAVVTGMPEDHYHGHEISISKSGLDLIARSPAHYRYAPPREPTRAMAIGTALHTALLEPERFREEYVDSGAADRRASEYKQAVKSLGDETRVLTASEYARIDTAVEAVYAQPVAARTLNQSGHIELSVFAHDPVTGIPVRCRFDLLTHSGVAIDLKKTQDARRHAFSQAVARYRYEVQAAFYADVWHWATGRTLGAYAFLGVEDEPPHGCMVHVLSDRWLARGRRLYREALNTYAQCLTTDEWPAYDTEPQVLDMPRWVEMQEEAEEISDE